MDKAIDTYPRKRGFIKNEIFDLSIDDLECTLIYTPFSEEAFPRELAASVKKLTIITFTAPMSLATTLKVIKKRYPLIQSVTLVIGLAYSKKDLENTPNVNGLNKLSMLKSAFENGLRSFLKELRSLSWNNTDITLTLHNHCHIKYFQAGDTCITGSQNFSGTIAKASNTSAYSKNELTVHVYQSEAKLNAISEELIKYLHAHDDEFVNFDKPSLLSQQFSVTDTFDKLKDKRLSWWRKRDKYDEVFREIDNDYFLEVMHEIDMQEKLEKSENKHIPPSQFDIYERSHYLLESGEFNVTDLLSAISTLEEAFEFSELSEMIKEKKSEIVEAFDDLISLSFGQNTLHLLSSHEDIGLDVPEAQFLVNKVLQDKAEFLANEYLKDYYIDLLRHCNDVLKEHNFHEASDYIKFYQSEIVDELIQKSPCLLPIEISEHYHDPDILLPQAINYVTSMDVSDIKKFAPRQFASQVESVIECILEFEA